MALINPPQLFTEGKVNLHSPYFNNVLQYQAHRQAKDEALDKYYGNLPNTINEQNVRDVDIPILHQQKDAIQQYYMQNRDAIKKGNTPEAFNMGKMFRDVQGTVQESKNRTATATKLAQLRGNPKYDYVFRDPNIIDKIQSHDLPVNDQNSKAINFNELTLPPAPFDVHKHLQGISGVKPNEDTPVYQDIPGDKFNRLQITPKKFSPEDLNAIHIYSQTQLDQNPSFENQIKEHIQKDPALSAQMADIFQKNYGHPIQNEGDLATAYTLSLRDDISPTQKTVKNDQALIGARNAEREKLIGLHLAASKQLKDYGELLKTGDKIKQDKAVDGFIDDQVSNSEEIPEDFDNFGKGTALNANADPVIKGVFAKKTFDASTGQSHTIYPEKVVFLDGGKKVRLVGDGFGETFSRDQYKAALVNKLFNTEAKRMQLSGKTITTPTEHTTTVKTNNPSGFSKQDLMDNGWSKEQIKKAVKAGKIKVN